MTKLYDDRAVSVKTDEGSTKEARPLPDSFLDGYKEAAEPSFLSHLDSPKYFGRDNSQVTGQMILDAANKNGVDARILAAVIANESGWGAASNARSANNFAGIMGAGDELIRYKTPQAGVDAAASLLRRRYVDKGLKTPEEIGPVYAPTEGATNDPQGINSNWVRTVRSIYNRIPDPNQSKPQPTPLEEGGEKKTQGASVWPSPKDWSPPPHEYDEKGRIIPREGLPAEFYPEKVPDYLNPEKQKRENSDHKDKRIPGSMTAEEISQAKRDANYFQDDSIFNKESSSGYKLYFFEGRNTGIAARSAEEARAKKKRGGDKIVAVREPSESDRKKMERGEWVRTRQDGKSPEKSDYGKGRGQGPPRKSASELPDDWKSASTGEPTRTELIEAGECCGGGCENCPYDPRHVAGTKKVKPLDKKPESSGLPDSFTSGGSKKASLEKEAWGGRGEGYAYERMPMVYTGAYNGGWGEDRFTPMGPAATAEVLDRAQEIADHFGLDSRVDFAKTDFDEVAPLFEGEKIDQSEGVSVGDYAKALRAALDRGDLEADNWGDNSDFNDHPFQPLTYSTTIPPLPDAKPVSKGFFGRKNELFDINDYDFRIDPIELAYAEWEIKNAPKFRKKQLPGGDPLIITPDGDLVLPAEQVPGEEDDEVTIEFPEVFIPRRAVRSGTPNKKKDASAAGLPESFAEGVNKESSLSELPGSFAEGLTKSSVAGLPATFASEGYSGDSSSTPRITERAPYRINNRTHLLPPEMAAAGFTAPKTGYRPDAGGSHRVFHDVLSSPPKREVSDKSIRDTSEEWKRVYDRSVKGTDWVAPSSVEGRKNVYGYGLRKPNIYDSRGGTTGFYNSGGILNPKVSPSLASKPTHKEDFVPYLARIRPRNFSMRVGNENTAYSYFQKDGLSESIFGRILPDRREGTIFLGGGAKDRHFNKAGMGVHELTHTMQHKIMEDGNRFHNVGRAELPAVLSGDAAKARAHLRNFIGTPREKIHNSNFGRTFYRAGRGRNRMNAEAMGHAANRYMYGEDHTGKQVRPARHMTELLATPEGEAWLKHMSRKRQTPAKVKPEVYPSEHQLDNMGIDPKSKQRAENFLRKLNPRSRLPQGSTSNDKTLSYRFSK